MTRKHQTLVILVLGLLVALVNPRPAKSESPAVPQRQAPQVEVVDVGLASVGLSGARVLLKLNVRNPNSEALTVDAIYWHLQLNQLAPLRGRIVQREVFPANQTRAVKVPVELPYGASLPAVLAVVQEPEGALYKISGKVKLKDEAEMIAFEHEGKVEKFGGSKPLAVSGKGAGK